MNNSSGRWSVKQHAFCVQFQGCSTLPQTAAQLQSVLESPTEYAVRRIRRAGLECLHEQVSPSRNQLIERAGMRAEIAGRPEVEAAIEDALLKLVWLKPSEP